RHMLRARDRAARSRRPTDRVGTLRTGPPPPTPPSLMTLGWSNELADVARLAADVFPGDAIPARASHPSAWRQRGPPTLVKQGTSQPGLEFAPRNKRCSRCDFPGPSTCGTCQPLTRECLWTRGRVRRTVPGRPDAFDSSGNHVSATKCAGPSGDGVWSAKNSVRAQFRPRSGLAVNRAVWTPPTAELIR